jgi:hypothetical protein
MRSFTITFDEDGTGEPRRIEFHADDPGLAFDLLEDAGAGREATLWEGDKRLGSLSLSEMGYWQLGR